MKCVLISVAVLLVAMPVLAQEPGWIGVNVSDRTEPGVIVRTIEPNSPAAKAGLRENDVIIEYNRQEVTGGLQLTRMVRETPVGRTVEVKVRRDNRDQTFQLTTEVIPNRFGRFRGLEVVTPDVSVLRDRLRDIPRIEIRSSQFQAGLRVDQLTDQLRTFFGVQGGAGVLVASVEPGSDAEKAGLKAGDVIISVGGVSVSNPSEFGREIRGSGTSIALKIIRDKQEREITMVTTR